MIIPLLFSVISGMIAGCIFSGGGPEEKGFTRESALKKILLMFITGVLLSFVLSLFPVTTSFYYILGIIPVFFGIHFLGILRLESPIRNSITASHKKVVIRILGNVILLAALFAVYVSSAVPSVLLFAIFGISTLISMECMRYIRKKLLDENVSNILEISEMINGIFLVITGLLIFSGEIMVLNDLVNRILK